MKRPTLTVPEKHQKKIAIHTLKMHDAGVAIMGGMDKFQARCFLLNIGYSSAQIEAIENGTATTLPVS